MTFKWDAAKSTRYLTQRERRRYVQAFEAIHPQDDADAGAG